MVYIIYNEHPRSFAAAPIHTPAFTKLPYPNSLPDYGEPISFHARFDMSKIELPLQDQFCAQARLGPRPRLLLRTAHIPGLSPLIFDTETSHGRKVTGTHDQIDSLRFRIRKRHLLVSPFFRKLLRADLRPAPSGRSATSTTSKVSPQPSSATFCRFSPRPPRTGKHTINEFRHIIQNAFPSFVPFLC